MTDMMDVLIVEPGKAPRPAQISNTLEAVEEALGGTVQIGCFLPQRVLMASREKTAGLARTAVCPAKTAVSAGLFSCAAYPRKGSVLSP